MKFSKLYVLIGVLCFCTTPWVATAADTAAGRGVNDTSTQTPKTSDTAVGRGMADTAKQAEDVSKTANQVGDVGKGVSNTAGAFNNVGSVDSALSGADSALGGINSSAAALDKIFDAGITDSIKDETNALGELSKSVGDLSGIMNGVQGDINTVKQLIDDPQALLNMALGQISFEKISEIAMNVAMEEAMDLIFTKQPASGSIPLETPGMKAQKAIQKATEEEMSDIDKKIQEEKDKQLEAQGGKPATPAPEQTGTKNDDTSEPQPNPSKDNCPAYMSQFPWATSIAYDVVKENVLPQGDKSKYAPGQKTWDSAVAYIKSNFYIQDPKDLTPAEQQKVTKKRQEYFQEVNSNLFSTALLVQQGLVDDATSISKAPTSGCNLIDDININTQTMMVIAKQTMADIALQARMLELEALRELKTQPLLLRSEPQYVDPLDFLKKQGKAATDAKTQTQTPAATEKGK